MPHKLTQIRSSEEKEKNKRNQCKNTHRKERGGTSVQSKSV